MAPNIIGLGLLVAGVIFLIVGGVVLWILGVICVLGGVGCPLDDLAAQATRRDLTSDSPERLVRPVAEHLRRAGALR